MIQKMNNSKVHQSVRVANEIGDSKKSTFTFTEQMNCVLTSFSMKIRKLNETFKYVSFGLLSYKRRIRNLLQFVFRLFCFAFFPRLYRHFNMYNELFTIQPMKNGKQ